MHQEKYQIQTVKGKIKSKSAYTQILRRPGGAPEAEEVFKTFYRINEKFKIF